MGEIRDRIKDIPFIKELDENYLKGFFRNIHLKQYKKHVQIFSQDSPLIEVFLILKGMVKIYKRKSCGREQIVWILQSGDIFPVVDCFGKVSLPANAEAIEDSLIVSIGLNDFESMLLDNPTILIKLFGVMSDRIIELQARLEEQILLGKYLQIVKLILRLCEKHGEVHQNNLCLIKRHFSNLDLAKMVGTSQEVISRVLGRLKKERLIYQNNGGFLLIDFEKMKKKYQMEL